MAHKTKEEYLKECLVIEPEAITEEFVRIPGDLSYWNAEYSRALQESLDATTERKRVRAELYLNIRTELLEDGHKVTEGIVDASVESHPDYVEAQKAENEAAARKADVYGTLDSVRAKKDMLVSLGAMLREEMGARTPTSGSAWALAGESTETDMGCDIHFFVEYKHPEKGWTNIMFDEWYQLRLSKEVGSEEAARTVMALQKQTDRYASFDAPLHVQALHWGWYHGRDYRLFGVLAGVRDYSVKPISEPRGLPKDVSEHVRFYPHGSKHWGPAEWAAEYGDDYADPSAGHQFCDDLLNEDEGIDWHSRTWLSLGELKAYNWTEPQRDEGIVDEATYKLWLDNGAKGAPGAWCGGVGGPGVRVVPRAHLDAILQGCAQRDPEVTSYYTRIEWFEGTANPSFNFTVEQMSEMAEMMKLGPDDVRAVFYFDN